MKMILEKMKASNKAKRKRDKNQEAAENTASQ